MARKPPAKENILNIRVGHGSGAENGEMRKAQPSQNQETRELTPDKFPDPWSVDTEYLLKELTRIREVTLRIPVNSETYSSIQLVINALWNFEEHVRFCLQLQRQGQEAFRRKAIRADEKSRRVRKDRLVAEVEKSKRFAVVK